VYAFLQQVQGALGYTVASELQDTTKERL
jgi:hypothetical protein